jgi:taurine dioxygenase
VLVWDHLGTIHNAVPDYDIARGEERLMLRCQVMAESIADPDIRRRWLEAA